MTDNMSQRRFFHEYKQIFSPSQAGQGHHTLFDRDFSRKNFCPCGEDFLSFAKEHFPDLMEEPTPQTLEQALLTITREYAYRKKVIGTEHRLNFCLRDCFEELLDVIAGKLEELHRLPQSSTALSLELGLDPEKMAGEDE